MPLVSEHGWKQQVDDMANVWVSTSKTDERKKSRRGRQRKLDWDMHEGARAPCEVLAAGG